MKKLLLMLVFAPVFLNAQSASLLELHNLKTPESVKIHNEKLYVSNLGDPNIEKDGFLVKADLDGKNSSVLFENLLDSPKGFAFLNDDIVLIADQLNHGRVNGNLVLANTKTNKILSKKVIPGSNFLNDVAYLGDNRFAVSDSGTNRIYEVTVNPSNYNIVYRVLSDRTIGPNGVFYDAVSNRLFVAGSNFGGDKNGGKVYSIDMTNKEVKSLLMDMEKLGTGALDGIYFDKDFGTLYVSDWGEGDFNSLIYVLNPVPFGSYMVTQTIKSGLTSAADFDIYKNTIYVPEFNKNVVSTVPLGDNLVTITEKELAAKKGGAAVGADGKVQSKCCGIKTAGAIVLALLLIGVAIWFFRKNKKQ